MNDIIRYIYNHTAIDDLESISNADDIRKITNNIYRTHIENRNISHLISRTYHTANNCVYPWIAMIFYDSEWSCYNPNFEEIYKEMLKRKKIGQALDIETINYKIKIELKYYLKINLYK